ncbi:YqzM family protein [Macrococcoides canis]|uniref:YqzM family protein n=1 Tax=Macrococcoides canis TaxID=1855823 RepID=A0A4R6C7Z2_9STAP|nr:YqzM family protein [Macrococcus canis]MEE1108009.1 YqzM family protein [Macrococcus canis]TDM18437.1 YqzM family protein [Macrococcus canis]TDM21516.1 YqzM family protein [Macrococcus canis]TDM23609.1 YqzM family protein [Macrococcus canis]TDM31655.1 YqzM family protein [Macrococcus canis]
MNQFEKNVQSKNNDVQDSGYALLFAFGGFATIYIIAQIFDLIAK